MVTRVNDTAFQMYSKGLRSVSVTCGVVTERARLEGMKIVDINPGCTAFVEGRTFLSALKPSAVVDSIVTAFPEEFLTTWNFSKAMMDQGLESFESVSLKELSEGAKTLQGFQPWSLEGHGLVGVWIVLIIVSTALVVGVIALCVWRKRIAMLWSLTGSSNREGAVSWNRRSSKQVELHEDLDQLRVLIRNLQQAPGNQGVDEEALLDE